MRDRARLLLVGSTVINALGSGVYLPLSLVLLRGLSGLPLAQVGLALTLAQIVALVVMPVVGRLSDRVGAKAVLVASMLVQGAGFVAYTVAASFPVFVAVSVAIAIGNQSGKSARPLLIAEVATGPDRDRLLALNRSLANAGLGLGGLLLAVLPKTGDTAFAGISLFNGATFLLAGLLTLGIGVAPRAGAAASPGGLAAVLRDRAYRRYLAASVLSSVLYAALTTLIPLYVVLVLDLSSTLAGVLFTVNTVLTAVGGVPVMAVLQRAGLRPSTSAAAGILLMGGGIALLGLCTALDRTAAGVVVLAALVVYTLGELMHSPCATALSLDAAPDGRRGRYQAAYQMTWTVGAAIAPMTFTFLLERVSPGAILLAVVLAVASAALLARPRTPSVAAERPAALPH